jgi:hypothetical protein
LYNFLSSRSNTIVFTRINNSSLIDKQAIYDTCKSFTQTRRLLGPLQRNIRNGTLFFPNSIASLQDIHLLLRYAPRKNSEGGIYLQLATSFLLSKNLQRLSKEQQIRTRVGVFLSERYSQNEYNQLESWFKSIYAPYTAITRVIRTPNGNQASWEFMMKQYVKNIAEIHLNTILFQLENDYICEADMLQDTIEFFASHNPCFVFQVDYPDRYRMDINDDDGRVTVVAGRTRIWRSVPGTTASYACRLKTFLAFEDIIMQPKDDWGASHKVRARGGDAIFFSAIPSYGAHTETLLWPNSNDSLTEKETAAFYKNWWLLARRALAEAQNSSFFPAMPIANIESFLK